MITAADTNILLDIIQNGGDFKAESQELLDNARVQGQVIVCYVVYAELAGAFMDRAALDRELSRMGITVSPISASIAYEAGLRWIRYRRSGGPRTRVLPDFLIGAHALLIADAFLTRDSGFYRVYFPELSRV